MKDKGKGKVNLERREKGRRERGEGKNEGKVKTHENKKIGERRMGKQMTSAVKDGHKRRGKEKLEREEGKEREGESTKKGRGKQIRIKRENRKKNGDTDEKGSEIDVREEAKTSSKGKKGRGAKGEGTTRKRVNQLRIKRIQKEEWRNR